MRLSQWRRVIVQSARDIDQNHTLAFAAALSYYFVMAFFPALIGLAAIIAYLPIPNLFNTMVGTLSRVMPPESMGLVRKVVAEIITPIVARCFPSACWERCGVLQAASPT